MTRPVFVTWLWNARGGWRANAGYTPEIIAGVQNMLYNAAPGCRHICIADDEYHQQLEALAVEAWPLWDTHGQPRGSRHGFDCHARLGLYGQPGAELAQYLGADVVQWLDADVMIKPGTYGTLCHQWDEQPAMYWVPRGTREMQSIFAFGDNKATWLGVNGSMVRLRLGSRPDWWQALASPEWVADTEAHVCGSDQAALTRLILEDIGQPWREGNDAILHVPCFDSRRVVAHGQGAIEWDVAFFPYDPFNPSGRISNFTKPWLSGDAQLRRKYRILAGMASESEQRAAVSVGLRRSGASRA